MQMATMINGLNPIIPLVSQDIQNFGIAPETVISGYTLLSDGRVQRQDMASFSDIGNWLQSFGIASQWEVRVTVVSGTLSSGTSGAWLALSTSRAWSVSRSTNGTSVVELTVEIRNASSLAVATSTTVFLTVNSEI